MTRMALGSRILLVALLNILCGPARIGGISLPGLPPISKNPPILELNGRVVMRELLCGMGPKANLDDLPDAELHDLREAGFEGIYIMGLFKTGALAKAMAIERLVKEDPTVDETAVCASPYAISDYSVDEHYGGDQALARLRSRMHAQGLRLFLDFVPNHMAVDHPWTGKRPELLIQGTEADLENAPQNWFRVGDKHIFAHGRDPYFDAWEETVQLNYGHPELRTEMCSVLAKIAGMCDGVRCDMGNLLLPEVLEKTWGANLTPTDGAKKVTGAFFPDAIKVARAVNPDFLVMGEVFWGHDPELQEQGFDLTFDKAFYDTLVAGKGAHVVDHLKLRTGADPSMAVRYLETHDEERATEVFASKADLEEEGCTDSAPSQHQAAAVLAYTCPGAKFLHDGQMQGRRKKMSLYSNQLPKERRDPEASMLYANLLERVMTRPEVIDGEWAMCQTAPSMDNNPSYLNVVSYCCWDEDGNAIFVVVNYSDQHSTAHVVLPDGVRVGSRTRPVPSSMRFSEDLRVSSFTSAHGKAVTQEGPSVLMRDLITPAWFERKRSVLMGQHNGVWFSLAPWQAHVFDLSMLGGSVAPPPPAEEAATAV